MQWNYEGFVWKIQVELPKPHIIKETLQSLLYDIGGEYYTKKINEKLPPLKKLKMSKIAQDKEDEIKIHLQM